ncbi:MAG: Fic family protein [Pseudomonadota bacterium]
MYIHQRENWSEFTWDREKLSNLLAEARYLQGRLLGRMGVLGFHMKNEASLQTLTQDVIKSSEIEGERLNIDQVHSSIARRLGIDTGGMKPTDRNVEGIVEIMLDATSNYNQPLTKTRLCNWQAALFPTGRSGMHKITIGKWRGESSGPMQVISGPFGREKIHYEALDYNILDQEMQKFIKWVETKSPLDLVIKAAIAHFWFVTIHPFDDGNGRIARVIADMILARSENSPHRFYSMSSEIQLTRSSYYNVLEKCQKGTSDITIWIELFLNCLKHAINDSEKILEKVLKKAKFWEIHGKEQFNERQHKMINLLLDSFDGKLTSSKWAILTKCSQDTALRDITELLTRQILAKECAGGRSTSYIITNERE